MLKAVTNCFSFFESFFKYQGPLDFFVMDVTATNIMNKLIFEELYIQLLLKIKDKVEVIYLKESTLNNVEFLDFKNKSACVISFTYNFSEKTMLKNILYHTIEAYLYCMNQNVDDQKLQKLYKTYKNDLLEDKEIFNRIYEILTANNN